MELDIVSLVPQIGLSAAFYVMFTREREYSKGLVNNIQEYIKSNTETNAKLEALLGNLNRTIESQGKTLRNIEAKVNNLTKK